MNKIILDQSTWAKFGNLNSAVEFCDETGRVLGVFCPADQLANEVAEPPMSQEELRRREREVGGYSTAELLNYLHSLHCVGMADVSA